MCAELVPGATLQYRVGITGLEELWNFIMAAPGIVIAFREPAAGGVGASHISQSQGYCSG